MASNMCTYVALKALDAAEKCGYVKENCTERGIFNFWYFNYCIFNNTLWLTIVLGFLVLGICFYLLQTTAENFLTPILKNLSKKLKLSENISGVTLIAFANGAPDIVTALNTGGSKEGTYISIGSLVGACLFGTSIIIARSIFVSKKPIVIESWSWCRD